MKRVLIPLAGLLAVACSNTADEANNTPPAATTTTTTTGTTPAATTGQPASVVSFATVQPILTTNCLPCHSAANKKGGFVAGGYADVMKPAEHGPVVIAGDPDKSLLIMVLKGPVAKPKLPQMPAKHAPLAAGDIQKIADWIKAGAKA
ncbi:MAG: hypothetical protein QOJ65_1724 [Fimbriimonadaceae bacterium]|jgi:hypothetical protein|nr:hypothetical protein [Fimbriimonadaceae bacterium]